jgi:hypothetical protein
MIISCNLRCEPAIAGLSRPREKEGEGSIIDRLNYSVNRSTTSLQSAFGIGRGDVVLIAIATLDRGYMIARWKRHG